MPNCISSTFSFSISPAWETPPQTLKRGSTPRTGSASCSIKSKFRAYSSANDAAKRIPNSGPQERKSDGELGFKEKRDEQLNFERSPLDEKIAGSDDICSVIAEEHSQVKESGGGGLEKENDLEEIDRKLSMRRVRQTVKRSNIVAKQVISIQSALSLGFVSQLWVDTTTWIVMVVEVKPNLLSGESERFLLEDILQVGDVVLVENENVIENPIKMFRLETLVGYEVVTPARQTIGKVRGYSFNINSGIVESLELDSFGISIIPSSLVSTYALFVEDVLEVASDRVIVHEEAASRIQRLTKGFWNTQKMRSADEYEQLYDFEKSVKDRKTRTGFRRRKFEEPGSEETDWDLPMDF